MTPPHPPIKHRCLQNHYTTDVSYIAQCTYTHVRLTPPPPPIKNRCLENHYTKSVAYIAQCTYTHGRLTPPIKQRCLAYCYTKLGTSHGRSIYIEQCTYTHVRLTPPIKHRCLEYCYTKLSRPIHIEQCIYTHGRLTPQSLEHRCLEYHYTKLGTSNCRTMHIYLWQMDSPVNQAEMPWILLHQTWQIYTYRTMYIYPWQIDPQSLEHRCLEYCYTKLGRSIHIEQCTYTYGRWTPSQSSIDALNTATPNLADLYIYIYIEQCIYDHGTLTPPNWAEMPWLLLDHTWHI